MNRNILIIILVVLIGAGAAFGLTRNHNKNTLTPTSNSTNSSNSTQNKTNNSQSSNNSTTPTATSSVSIENFAFMPPDITVKKGTTVTWTNNDSTAHTVTASSGKTGPVSSQLSPSAKYSFTFDQTGTFHYHCSIHPTMLGTVTVTE